MSVRNNFRPLGFNLLLLTPKKYDGNRYLSPGSANLDKQSAAIFEIPATCSTQSGLYDISAMSKAISLATRLHPYPLAFKFNASKSADSESDRMDKHVRWCFQSEDQMRSAANAAKASNACWLADSPIFTCMVLASSSEIASQKHPTNLEFCS